MGDPPKIRVKSLADLFSQGGRDPVKLLSFIDAEKASYPISPLCRMLKVSRSASPSWIVVLKS